MTDINQIAWDDTVLPFQLDRSGVRGRVARLDGVLEHILSRHDYPAPVAALVAEVALLAALIGPTVKLRSQLAKSHSSVSRRTTCCNGVVGGDNFLVVAGGSCCQINQIQGY